MAVLFERIFRHADDRLRLRIEVLPRGRSDESGNVIHVEESQMATEEMAHEAESQGVCGGAAAAEPNNAVAATAAVSMEAGADMRAVAETVAARDSVLAEYTRSRRQQIATSQPAIAQSKQEPSATSSNATARCEEHSGENEIADSDTVDYGGERFQRMWRTGTVRRAPSPQCAASPKRSRPANAMQPDSCGP